MRRRRIVSASLSLVLVSALAHAAPVGGVVAHEPIYLGNEGIGASLSGLPTIGEDGRVGYGIMKANIGSFVNTWSPVTGATASVPMPAAYYATSVVVANGGATYAAGLNYGVAGQTYVQAPDLIRVSGGTATALSAGLPQGAGVEVQSADGSSLYYNQSGAFIRYDLATGAKTTVYTNSALYSMGTTGVGTGGQYAAYQSNNYTSSDRFVSRRNADGTNTTITTYVTGNTFNWDKIYGVGAHAVDARGNVAFAAKTPGAGLGIYLGSGGALTQVAKDGDALFSAVAPHAEITADGRVVFSARDKANVQGFFQWDKGVTTRLATIGDTFLDPGGRTLTLTTLTYPGGALSGSFWMNTRGDVMIGGIFTDTGNPIGNYEALGLAVIPAPVPEPASFAALAIGALALVRRRRRG